MSRSITVSEDTLRRALHEAHLDGQHYIALLGRAGPNAHSRFATVRNIVARLRRTSARRSTRASKGKP